MKKKTALFLTILILLSMLLPAASIVCAASDPYGTIRVRLSHSAASLSVKLAGKHTAAENGSLALPAGTYTVSVSGGSIAVKGGSIDAQTGASLTLAPAGAEDTVSVGGTAYLGTMRFSIAGGKLVLTNTLPLEKYLYGVVAYEMSDSFPAEALKAQAVCARGYAIRSLSPSSDHDIGDTSSDQVYRGYDPSHKNVIAAVDATAGKVLTHSGKIISTYYTASNGGQTELPGNAWGGGAAKNSAYPYLAQHDDPYDIENSSSPFQSFFIPAAVEGSAQDCVASSGSKIVRVVNCNVSCNVRSGPGTNYPVIGSASLSAVFEWLADAGDWFKIKYNNTTAYISASYGAKASGGRFLYASPAMADIQQKAFAALTKAGKSIDAATDVKIISVADVTNKKERWPGTGSKSCVSAAAHIAVKYIASGKSELSSATELDIVLALMDKSGESYILAHDYLNSNLRLRYISAAKDGYVIENRRFGHGVGLSQRGAQTMAATYGKGYAEILAFYFPGTALSSVDTATPTPAAPVLTGSYAIEAGTISGVAPGMSVSSFKKKLSVADGTLRLTDAKGAAKSDGTVCTGDTVRLLDAGGSPHAEYTVSVKGDIDGDGKASLKDLLRLQKHLLGTTVLKGASLKAADVSGDGKVKILDLLKIQKHLLGTDKITE